MFTPESRSTLEPHWKRYHWLNATLGRLHLTATGELESPLNTGMRKTGPAFQFGPPVRVVVIRQLS